MNAVVLIVLHLLTVRNAVLGVSHERPVITLPMGSLTSESEIGLVLSGPQF